MRRYFGGPQAPNAEFVPERERQAPPDPRDTSGYLAGAKERAVGVAPVGTPPTFYDVRCVYDSRPVNAYDFNLTTTTAALPHGGFATTQFIVPSGYRAVPRKWMVSFEPIPVANPSDITFYPQAYGADVPNNAVLIGSGTAAPIETFFLVEENATFGARIADPNALAGGNVYIQVWGNLLPVTGVALPFEVSNRKV